jgi:hypothetical protein
MVSYARAASSGVSNVPSQSRSLPRVILAAQRPEGRNRTRWKLVLLLGRRNGIFVRCRATRSGGSSREKRDAFGSFLIYSRRRAAVARMVGSMQEKKTFVCGEKTK